MPVGVLALSLSGAGLPQQPAPADSDVIASSAAEEPGIYALADRQPSTPALAELRTTMRVLIAPHQQTTRLRRASRQALRRQRRRRPL